MDNKKGVFTLSLIGLLINFNMSDLEYVINRPYPLRMDKYTKPIERESYSPMGENAPNKPL